MLLQAPDAVVHITTYSPCLLRKEMQQPRRTAWHTRLPGFQATSKCAGTDHILCTNLYPCSYLHVSTQSTCQQRGLWPIHSIILELSPIYFIILRSKWLPLALKLLFINLKGFGNIKKRLGLFCVLTRAAMICHFVVNFKVLVLVFGFFFLLNLRGLLWKKCLFVSKSWKTPFLVGEKSLEVCREHKIEF